MVETAESNLLWMVEEKLNVLITRGKPTIVEWAEQGLNDAIQYDLKDYEKTVGL